MSVKVYDESKGLSDGVITKMTALKDTILAIIRDYVRNDFFLKFKYY